MIPTLLCQNNDLLGRCDQPASVPKQPQDHRYQHLQSGCSTVLALYPLLLSCWLVGWLLFEELSVLWKD